MGATCDLGALLRGEGLLDVGTQQTGPFWLADGEPQEGQIARLGLGDLT
jgi:hypothetical protein